MNGIVRSYRNLLRREGVAFTRIYLYGSHATGRARRDSDIDVAVVCKRQPRDVLGTRMRLRRLAPRVDVRIEPILLTERDLIPHEESIIAHEVKRHGIRIP